MAIVDNVNNYIESLELPDVQVEDSVKNLDISGIGFLPNATDDQLSEMLLFYGSWKAFIETQLSELEAERSILSEYFHEGLFKGYYEIHKEYSERSQRAPIKDAVRGQILATNPQLNKTKKDLMEIEAKVAQLKGVKESYKTLYDTVSRVVAIRLRGKIDE